MTHTYRTLSTASGDVRVRVCCPPRDWRGTFYTAPECVGEARYTSVGDLMLTPSYRRIVRTHRQPARVVLVSRTSHPRYVLARTEPVAGAPTELVHEYCS